MKGLHEDRPLERQTISEVDLIRLAQDGNPEAFGELYRLHLDAIYRYVYSRIGETAEAENLTQTTFVKAWRALGGYRQRQVPFRGWLYRIAHNTIVDHYRTRREPDCRLEDLELVDTSNVPEETFVSQERQEALRKALTRLKPAYQQVLTLRFLNGLDYPETAQVLGRNVNAVRVLQFRALKALRAVLAEDSVVR
jgi:RNA polymerase sigma-70 factor (ECF subfamily)